MKNRYDLTDGCDVWETRLMTDDEFAIADREAQCATDGIWYWVPVR